MGTGEASLRHLKRALELLAVVTGQDHPEVASTMINIAMHYHELGRYGTALRYLQVSAPRVSPDCSAGDACSIVTWVPRVVELRVPGASSQ